CNSSPIEIYVKGPSAGKVTIQNNQLKTCTDGNFTGIRVEGLADIDVSNNVIDSRPAAGAFFSTFYGFQFIDSNGTASSNSVYIPATTSGATMTGYQFNGPRGGIDFGSNTLGGGATAGGVYQIHVNDIVGTTLNIHDAAMTNAVSYSNNGVQITNARGL